MDELHSFRDGPGTCQRQEGAKVLLVRLEFPIFLFWACLVVQQERVCLPVQEMRVGSLGWEDPLEKEMTTHSSILAWETP